MVAAAMTGAVLTASILASASSNASAFLPLSYTSSLLAAARSHAQARFGFLLDSPLVRPLVGSWWPSVAAVLLVLLLHFEISASPVRITHADDTTPIEEWDAQYGRVRRIPLHLFIRERCPTLVRGVFYPNLFLFNGDLQTIFASAIAQFRDRRVFYEREILNTPDGGIISIDWSPKLPTTDLKAEKVPLMVIFHGLTGGSHETYVQDLVERWNEKGYRAVVVNSRGCAETELKSHILYSAGWTEDVRLAVNYIKRILPNTPLFATGFSLGANFLTKFVGEEGDKCPFVGFTAVANPFDLLVGIKSLHHRWIGRAVYSPAMANNLKRVYLRHQHMIHKNPHHAFEAKTILDGKTIEDFDQNLTSKVFGFRTGHEYYRMSSSAQYVPDIKIPGMFLSALDDPVASALAIPRYEILANPNLFLATTKKGGHIGWFDGYFSARRWFAKPLVEFAEALVQARLSIPADLEPVEVHHPAPAPKPRLHQPYSKPGHKPPLAPHLVFKHREHRDTAAAPASIPAAVAPSSGNATAVVTKPAPTARSAPAAAASSAGPSAASGSFQETEAAAEEPVDDETLGIGASGWQAFERFMSSKEGQIAMTMGSVAVGFVVGLALGSKPRRRGVF
ncbi:Alpha/Beta hydrolase protein [Zopfochytrium polystomum]|nr:Alpha/Beta hydrolase protein [Zopfochytrium polystomum]